MLYALFSLALAASPTPFQPEPRVEVKRTPTEHVLHVAHVLKNHFGHHPETAAIANHAIGAHANGTLEVAHIMNVFSQVAVTMGPAAAAKADCEVTTEVVNAACGMGGNTHKQNEEGGSKGEAQDQMEGGDMAPVLDGVSTHEVEGIFKVVKRDSNYAGGWGKPWGNGLMKYCWSSSATDSLKHIVEKAITQFGYVMPCLTFQEIASKDDYSCVETPSVSFAAEKSGCWAHVGQVYGAQMNLEEPGCTSLGTTIHEILHLLGQMHEHSRPDRDTYVAINYAPIPANKTHNFDLYQGTDASRPYDMLSLMHYGSTAFSEDGSQTITPTDAAYSLYTNDSAQFHHYKLGNRLGMTQLDADQLAEQYGCTASTLTDKGSCVDKRNDAGQQWADSNGNGCDYYKTLPEGCSQYSAGSYCCDCGGGIQAQTWCTPEGVCGSAKARTDYPPAPPPAPVVPQDKWSNCAAMANDYGCSACCLPGGVTVGEDCPASCATMAKKTLDDPTPSPAAFSHLPFGVLSAEGITPKKHLPSATITPQPMA
jgi:hypothetical protein